MKYKYIYIDKYINFEVIDKINFDLYFNYNFFNIDFIQKI